MDYAFMHDKNGKPYISTRLTDYSLMANPLLNKGSAFSGKEREEFGLLGLIPPYESTIQTQALRSYKTFQEKVTDLEKYIYLRDLQDSNETLFYYVLTQNITEMLPIVYTPTVGLGCERYSHIYRRPRGIFISYPNQHNIDKILANPRFDHTKVIVVSDGERILGLGDQGAGGMGIPIGKLALYTACAGIHPSATLPILLDTGTNNADLQNDPLYIGWRHPRIRGKEYEEFIESFIASVKKRFPHVLLQWEDFAQINATPLLNRYRQQLCTFNDDIQGTAAVAVGALLAAMHVTNIPLEKQKIIVVGAGSAGCGISSLILQAMIEAGIPKDIAKNNFYLIDRDGLLTDNMFLLDFQKPFAKPGKNLSLLEVIQSIHPTLLVGVSGQAGVFTEEIVREMAQHVERPVIFPLSNPTSKAEANPLHLMKWTDDRAIIGTGSPFPDIMKNGNVFRIDQTNNSYIFPGVGLGLIAVHGREITDKMFLAAAKALAECSPAKDNPHANLLPPLSEIRNVSFKVAMAVAEEAIGQGLADFTKFDNLADHIKSLMWNPDYLPFKKIEK